MWDTCWQNFDILGLQPRDKAAMLGVNTLEFFLEEYSHEDGVQFTYQRGEIFLFLITSMTIILVSPLDSMMHCLQYYCSFISLESKTIAPS